VIFMGDIFVVAQDWDFPAFENPIDVKVVGTDMESLSFPSIDFHISGKWMNFGIMSCVMVLDCVCLMGLVMYEPTFNGQYLDPVTKEIWSMNSLREIDQLAMAYALWQNDEDKVGLLLRQDMMSEHINPQKDKTVARTFPGIISVFQLTHEDDGDVTQHILDGLKTGTTQDTRHLLANLDSAFKNDEDYEPALWRLRKPFRAPELGLAARNDERLDFPLSSFHVAGKVGQYVGGGLCIIALVSFYLIYKHDVRLEVCNEGDTYGSLLPANSSPGVLGSVDDPQATASTPLLSNDREMVSAADAKEPGDVEGGQTSYGATSTAELDQAKG